MSNIKFPMIDKLELDVLSEYVIGIPGPTKFVLADDLERRLRNSLTIYAKKGASQFRDNWTIARKEGDTHKAILLGVTELPKEPIKIEKTFAATLAPENILKPLELFGKKFKVTFEEVIED